MTHAAPNGETRAEIQRLHRTVMRSVTIVCAMVAVIVWAMLNRTREVQQEVRVMRDSVLVSIKEAKDSGAVQRSRLKYRLDSMIFYQNRKRR